MGDTFKGRSSGTAKGRVTENDVEGKQVCKKCGKEKSLQKDFYRSPGNKSGYDSVCKKCRYEKQKERLQDLKQGKNRRDHNDEIKDALTLHQCPRNLIKMLNEAASRQSRTPENQAIWYIIEGLRRDGHGNDVLGD